MSLFYPLLVFESVPATSNDITLLLSCTFLIRKSDRGGRADLGSVAGGARERGRGSHVAPGDPEGCLEEWAMTWALGDEESTVLPIDVAIVAESPPPPTRPLKGQGGPKT